MSFNERTDLFPWTQHEPMSAFLKRPVKAQLLVTVGILGLIADITPLQPTRADGLADCWEIFKAIGVRLSDTTFYQNSLEIYLGIFTASIALIFTQQLLDNEPLLPPDNNTHLWVRSFGERERKLNLWHWSVTILTLPCVIIWPLLVVGCLGETVQEDWPHSIMAIARLTITFLLVLTQQALCDLQLRKYQSQEVVFVRHIMQLLDAIQYWRSFNTNQQTSSGQGKQSTGIRKYARKLLANRTSTSKGRPRRTLVEWILMLTPYVLAFILSCCFLDIPFRMFLAVILFDGVFSYSAAWIFELSVQESTLARLLATRSPIITVIPFFTIFALLIWLCIMFPVFFYALESKQLVLAGLIALLKLLQILLYMLLYFCKPTPTNQKSGDDALSANSTDQERREDAPSANSTDQQTANQEPTASLLTRICLKISPLERLEAGISIDYQKHFSQLERECSLHPEDGGSDSEFRRQVLESLTKGFDIVPTNESVTKCPRSLLPSLFTPTYIILREDDHHEKGADPLMEFIKKNTSIDGDGPSAPFKQDA